MPRAGKFGVAASLVYDYLKPLALNSITQEDISSLESFIAGICQKYPGDIVFINILRDFGWNRTAKRFDYDSLDLLDLRGLKMALSKKSLMMMTTRQSHMGPNISPKSYAPSILLNYLTYICALQTAQPPLKGTTSSSENQHLLSSSSRNSHHDSTHIPHTLNLQHVSSKDEQEKPKHSNPSHHAHPTHHHDHDTAHGKRAHPRYVDKLVFGDDSSGASAPYASDVAALPILSPTPSSLFFHGFCLLADISGFTRLSGTFCAQGKLGLDGLQQATNGYMGRLVEVIYQHGGDIIKFAGDAIICVFLDRKTRSSISKGQCRTSPFTPLNSPLTADPDGDEGGAPCPVLAEEDGSFYCPYVASLALQCAMELRQISTEQLTVHVAASCGEMCFGVLGGYKDRWESLISGDCLMSLSQCLDDAPSREVAITPQLLRVLGPQWEVRFGAQLLPSGNYRLTTKPSALTDSIGASTASANSRTSGGATTAGTATTIFVGAAGVGTITGADTDISADTKSASENSKCSDTLAPETRSSNDDAQVQAAAAAFASTWHGNITGMRSVHMAAVASELEEEGEGELVDWVLQSSKPEYMRMVSSFIPLPVTLAFESGGLRYLAEIREVTTMFMKWDCYDPYTHRNLVSLQSAFFSVQSILDEAGGFLRQFLVDDKGCVLIACWGVPTASFTNNAHRALSAATKIHHHFLSINMSCSIGITTGNVYCGNVGSEMRREYAAIGDVVNLSARLMSKAKGGIYVDEATYSRLSVRMWEMFEELEPMMVKGKPQPIQAYAYHTSHAVPEVHNEGSGEGQEIQTTCKSFLKRALESLIRPALRKRSAKEEGEKERPALHTVVIEGRSGSGKFSTVQWLRRQAENRELRVIHIGGLEPNDSLLEYKVTAKLFSLLIGADVYNNPHSQHMVVIHLLHEIYGNNNDMIDKVALPAMRVAFNLSDQQLTMGNSLDNCNSSQNNSSNLILKRKVPARMIADTVREIFAYFLAEQAHVVIVENLHCCDDSSLKCLAALRDVRASSLVVYTLLSADEIKSLDTHVVSKQLNEHMPISRQGMHAKKVTAAAIPAVNHVVEGIEVFRNLLLQQPSVHYMVLDNYNVTEIEAMVSGALGMEQVPLGLAQWVQQLSGGSIYWIKEILQFLKSLGPEEFASVASFQSFGALARQSSMHSSVTKMFSFSESPDKGVSSPSALTLSQTSPGNAVSAVDAINAQLELLILCRFENLPQDDQRILKAASIIGCYFSKYVLYGILSTALKAQLQAALKTLLKERWIMKVTDLHGSVELPASTGLVGGLEAEYVFCHPTAWETLYELTPPGDRTKMHRSIAEYYENMTADDPHLFECISAHFSHVDEGRALEYSCRATLFYLNSDEQDLQHALALLEASCHYVSSLADLQVLQVLLGVAELVFYSDVDNIIIKRADGSLVRSPSETQQAATRSARAGGSNKSSGWGGGCCVWEAAAAIRTNKVAPESSMLSRSSGVSGRLSYGQKNTKLLRQDLSRNSVNAFTAQGKELVEYRLRVLDESLLVLRQSLEKQGKQGVLQRWQRNIVEARGEVDDDEYSWRSKSCIVSPRQF